uniref:Cation/H(+) antiporter 4-like n=1 Tax=Davidia involucrata TaxID=16924 RepID=A0A5B6Z7U9_DAVIN
MDVNGFCKADHAPLHSPGIWDSTKAKNFIHYVLPRLQIQVAILILFSQSLHLLLGRFFSSRVVSEILTFDEETFSSATFSVLVIAVVTPLLVRSIYDYSKIYAGYQQRNILHSAEIGELRVLACTHRQDDAWAAMKLLEASNPTKESPLSVHALHLMELVGRASPLLINHEFGQKTSTTGSRSQNVIDIFKYYEKQYSGLVDVQAFTAISMPKFMHHDICSLALDRFVSLIILPFHKKWNYQGKTIMDSNILRTINSNVLEMAPCSVGILLDRRKMQGRQSSVSLLSSTYRVAAIFLGGDDDREALAFARRMANSSEVQLTILRLMALELEDTGDQDNWEAMLDAEFLKDTRFQCSLKTNVVYIEKKVKDGPDTALIIRSMEEAFDLILVGRRHRLDSLLLSGLTEWTEMPELGAIGDLLASTDDSKPVSVLVVQQQLIQVK